MTEDQARKLEALHDAFLGVPAGSPEDATTLLEDVRVVVKAYQRASWLARVITWAVPTISVIAVAVRSTWEWFTK